MLIASSGLAASPISAEAVLDAALEGAWSTINQIGGVGTFDAQVAGAPARTRMQSLKAGAKVQVINAARSQTVAAPATIIKL